MGASGQQVGIQGVREPCRGDKVVEELGNGISLQLREEEDI